MHTSPDLTLESFYGVKPEEDDGDLASVVKRRRMLTAKAMEDKKRKDREDKEKLVYQYRKFFNCTRGFN